MYDIIVSVPRLRTVQVLLHLTSFFQQLSEQVKSILPKIPVGLQEAVIRMVHVDIRQRQTTQQLSLIQYFKYA